MAAAVEPNEPTNAGQRPATPGSQRDEAPLPPVPTGAGPTEELDPEYRERLQHVLSSDIGITTLLNRLKQSISSTRDFAAFLKERCVLEEKHAQGLKRLSRSTHESIGRPESRQGSFAHNYKELTSIHERMADHGLQFSNALFAMSEELHELGANTERGRKHWKQTGLNAEKRVQDAESAMEKAKGRYNSLAEQYDRARTGERQSSKFGLKKSGAQAEEDLRHKVEAADADYSAKVEAAQSQRNDLQSTYRPQTVNALQELIRETDAGLSFQVQKFAHMSEKLLLGFGLSITPLKGQSPIPGQNSRGLREVASGINNERDFLDYVLSFSNKAPSRANEIKYEKHPSLSPKQQQPGYGDQFYKEESYGQNYPPSLGRQVSGVTPYPGEEYGGESQYQGYGGPPPQQSFAGQGPNQGQQLNPQMRSSGPPQLPQISPSSGGQFGSDAGAISPVGPDAPAQPFAAGPGHVRNVSSIGSLGAPGQQSQPLRSPSPSAGPPSGQAGPGGAPVGGGQAPMGRGQAPQGMGREQEPLGMDRDQPQGIGRGAAPPGGVGRGQPQGRGRGAAPPGGVGRGQAPGIGRGAAPPGGAPPGGEGRGQPQGIGRGAAPPGGEGRGQPQGIGRGAAPPGGEGRGQPQGRGRGAAPPGGEGRGQPQGIGRGPAPPGGVGRGQAPPGAQVPGQGPQGGINQGQPQQSGLPQGQPPLGNLGRGQAPLGAIGRGQTPEGQMSQGQGLPGGPGAPPQGGLGRGALQGMERGVVPQGMDRGQAGPGPGPMGQFPQQQGMPPQNAGRGMPGPNIPTNGAPRPGGVGVNVLPSRKAIQRPGPPTRPVFGISLDELFQREGAAVPIIVVQCVEAVEMFGLDMEGIYRSSGSANSVMELRQLFDHDATAVDLPNHPVVHDDIASVTTLLKRFLGDLPDPLLTGAQYGDFIQAARVDEDIVRRDSIHALVNALPDPNYATLRVLAIHLHKIAQHADRNKMTHNNLAIVFAPTLMSQKVGVNGNGPGSADIADSAWQAKVVETILDNTFQIFDADEE